MVVTSRAIALYCCEINLLVNSSVVYTCLKRYVGVAALYSPSHSRAKGRSKSHVRSCDL